MGRCDPEITHDAARPPARHTLVALHGEIDLGTTPLVRTQLLETARQTPLDVVLDLSRASFLDCSAMAVIAAARDTLSARGRSLILRDARGVVRRALALTDLAGLLEEAGPSAAARSPRTGSSWPTG